jgi:hypothetical protein
VALRLRMVFMGPSSTVTRKLSSGVFVRFRAPYQGMVTALNIFFLTAGYFLFEKSLSFINYI